MQAEIALGLGGLDINHVAGRHHLGRLWLTALPPLFAHFTPSSGRMPVVRSLLT